MLGLFWNQELIEFQVKEVPKKGEKHLYKMYSK